MKKIIPLILLTIPVLLNAYPQLDDLYKKWIQEAEIVVFADYEQQDEEWKLYPIEVWRGDAGLIENGFVYARTPKGKKYEGFKGKGIFFFPEDPHHNKLRNFIKIEDQVLRNLPETSLEDLKDFVINNKS